MKNTWKVYVLALISFLVGTSNYIVSGILDRIAETLGTSVAAAGQLITVYSLAYAVGTPILMALTAKMDRRKLLLYSLGLFIAANLLTFILSGFGFFIAARIITALGAGVVTVNALSIAAKIAPPGKQASAIANVTMGITASLIIGVPLGRMVASAFGWKAVFLAIAIVGVMAMLVIAAVIPRMQGDKPVPLIKQFALLKKPQVLVALAITFFWLGGYSLAYTYISPFLLDVTHLNESLISAALFVFGIASLIGSKVGGYSADKRGIKYTLVSGMVLHVISFILLSFVGQSVIAVFAILILWSFAAWSSAPAQQFNLVSLVPESSGVMLSLNSSMMQLAMAVGAGIGGLIVNRVSLASITWFGLLGVVIAIIATFVLSSMASRHSVIQLAD
ncbi:MFS transporter [Heyndrickxia oleronia]|uniref:MFS transporter n=1 Tax=Heyndrickxia oleronia TaxID=38875 RepID=A0A8E2LDT2_9BACI|nr:MFS transporter [Heyndrickxia oleronia]MEC1376904.1 MFS transporter [Heyndrickxia oleronia]OOP66529.1 MFS transporter [Heyndrickxia oleronia]QQZ03745.1 MFS transporter [Heyndrickxia oleronia]GIN42343.1 putative MFS-type transporter YbcL [Heyndrickxia oleronia]